MLKCLEEVYGIAGVVEVGRLPGERDINFAVTTADVSLSQPRFVFKICGDPVARVECLALALEHIAAADPILPIPRLIKPLQQQEQQEQHLHGFLKAEEASSPRPCLLLTYLPGRTALPSDPSLVESAATELLTGSPGFFRQLGEQLGSLALSLRGFSHAAPFVHGLLWDVLTLPDRFLPLLEAAQPPPAFSQLLSRSGRAHV